MAKRMPFARGIQQPAATLAVFKREPDVVGVWVPPHYKLAVYRVEVFRCNSAELDKDAGMVGVKNDGITEGVRIEFTVRQRKDGFLQRFYDGLKCPAALVAVVCYLLQAVIALGRFMVETFLLLRAERIDKFLNVDGGVH